MASMRLSRTGVIALFLQSGLLVLSLVGHAAAQPDPDYSLEGFGTTPQPDLFTGTASTTIPIEAPPGAARDSAGVESRLLERQW